ncbi:MAG: hypothetical protein LBG97_00040 [Coriobacteriales bacterium]|jgi:hypothetical protein|nr:hypothetical protein [Coriobacteriales bacterium]
MSASKRNKSRNKGSVATSKVSNASDSVIVDAGASGGLSVASKTCKASVASGLSVAGKTCKASVASGSGGAVSNRKLRLARCQTLLTADDILEYMEGYQLVKMMTRVAIIGCIISVSGALLLRFNVSGYDLVPLFLNILSYVFAGAALFLWLARLRPMRKQARMQAEQHFAGLSEQEKKAVRRDAGLTDDTAVNKAIGSSNANAKQVTGSPEYLRYRRIWRVMLVAAAAFVVGATFSLNAFPDSPAIAITMQMLALIPIATAVYLYRAKLKPLKEEWQKHGG